MNQLGIGLHTLEVRVDSVSDARGLLGIDDLRSRRGSRLRDEPARQMPDARPLPITRRHALASVGALLTVASHAQASGDVFDGFAGTRVRFADVDAARALLMTDDEWMRATSEFQRRAVMGSATPVSLEAFRRWNGAAARPWSDELRARWRRALERLAPSFSALRIPRPAEVLLSASSGHESARAPYTRAHG
ncbi:MAG TPA: hypothetical protein VFO28_06505, partial [Burkholderiaceae bacterium]|nr:hypothetical protein [Burkholderiaceae bacterium]